MVKLIKNIITFISSVHCYYYLFLDLLGIKYKTISILISKWTGYYGISLRQNFYSRTLSNCGDNLKVFHGAYICYKSVSIGDNCTIEEDCVISNCEIGKDVIIAANVSVMSGKNHHDVDQLDKTFYETQSKQLDKVIIGNNIWIGTRAVIMAHISSGSVVGAGSVVNKNFSDENVIIAGVPAKLIRVRG
ncbi:TPA: DapH/DapD/GlmU-related protein [Vibrio parahaemolyticus]